MIHNRLIMLDWDDTLFPTSWTVIKAIDLTDSNVRQKYVSYFTELDDILSKFLHKCTNKGQVFIVTNAVKRWVVTSSNVLPKTKKIIDDKIFIISARDLFQQKNPNNMEKWKKYTFEQIVNKHDFKKQENTNFEHIISIGDAEYEFNALINLYSHKNKKRILKSIRFLATPTYDSLIDQLEVLYDTIDKICHCKKHMDLKFKQY